MSSRSESSGLAKVAPLSMYHQTGPCEYCSPALVWRTVAHQTLQPAEAYEGVSLTLTYC